MKRQIILIAHDVRSTHNVGSLLRTADGLGVARVWLTGITPYPATQDDTRLPHMAAKLDKQIAKTALGAERSVDWRQSTDLAKVVQELKAKGYEIVALEQAPGATDLGKFKSGAKTALLVGNEVDGLGKPELGLADKIVEIPMLGQKESLNVAIAAGITLHHLRFS